MAVYLLHSTVPLVLPDGREVRHYLGWTGEGNFLLRLHAHRMNRKSAKIVQAFLAQGGELCLGNYFPGLTPADERQMKRNGHIGNKCLICQIHVLQARLREAERTARQKVEPEGGPS